MYITISVTPSASSVRQSLMNADLAAHYRHCKIRAQLAEIPRQAADYLRTLRLTTLLDAAKEAENLLTALEATGCIDLSADPTLRNLRAAITNIEGPH